MTVEHGKGSIKDNAMAALVTSRLYKPKKFTDRTKYNRKAKHPKKGDES